MIAPIARLIRSHAGRAALTVVVCFVAALVGLALIETGLVFVIA